MDTIDEIKLHLCTRLEKILDKYKTYWGEMLPPLPEDVYELLTDFRRMFPGLCLICPYFIEANEKESNHEC